MLMSASGDCDTDKLPVSQSNCARIGRSARLAPRYQHRHLVLIAAVVVAEGRSRGMGRIERWIDDAHERKDGTVHISTWNVLVNCFQGEADVYARRS